MDITIRQLILGARRPNVGELFSLKQWGDTVWMRIRDKDGECIHPSAKKLNSDAIFGVYLTGPNIGMIASVEKPEECVILTQVEPLTLKEEIR